MFERVDSRANTDFELIARQFRNPIVLLLVVGALVSALLTEVTESLIIVLIIVVSGALGWIQERGAVRDVESLMVSVQVHVDVLRDGRETSVPLSEIVPGDVVVLNAGDIAPGDCRVFCANRLTVDEATLTGESVPREKIPGVVPSATGVAERTNTIHHGTHVVSGEGRALVVFCGADTELGKIAGHVVKTHVPTSFERGVGRYGAMLAKAAVALVSVVLAVNLLRGRPFLESVLFSLALTVGITPQMLPVIVTVSLASGARQLARHHAVVKRLDAIEDLGSIDTICFDKTGTLTTGEVRFVAACDPSGARSDRVLEMSAWNARLQGGFSNPIDDEIVAEHSVLGDEWPDLVAEVPFDFDRRMMSVVVRTRAKTVVITKGDVPAVLGRCRFSSPGDRDVALATFRSLSDQGLRVLAVASRELGEQVPYDEGLEWSLVCEGFLVFEDPVKHDAAEAVRQLMGLGIGVKLITGDNRFAARHTALAVGIAADRVATGEELRTLDDGRLRDLATTVDVFAEVDPITKERIVRTLSGAGASVGFLGDGVNDAAALHASDVGVSVQHGADVAKQVADVVLLEKDLTVLADAVTRGRRVFANTLTYVKVTTSANFGNMVSLAATSVFLPYLPLLSFQILLLNFLSDIPGVAVASDRVDEESLLRPGRWDISRVRSFMVIFGLVSSVVDLATFAVLYVGWGGTPEQLRTGWFAVSLLTEVAALLVLRTARPSWRSRPGRELQMASALVIVCALLVAVVRLPKALGFVPLSTGVIVSLVALVCAYVALTELVKRLVPRLVGESVSAHV